MKLLIVTQKVDQNDPILGFFHGWLIEFSKHFEVISVVCLEKGIFNLPNNVSVTSLGKEDGVSRSNYLSRFYLYIWSQRKNYDVVFVHMNQEYIILGGFIWKLLAKPIYFWRNHVKGSAITDIAAFFCKHIFCTSNHSYTTKFKKTVIMPVGVDTQMFSPVTNVQIKPNSLLFLGRISPIKKVEQFIEIVNLLRERGILVTATIVGDSLPKDMGYYSQIKKLVSQYNLEEYVAFKSAITQQETIAYYSSHEIYVNFTPPGSMDKTIFEAMACKSLVVFATPIKEDMALNTGFLQEGSTNNACNTIQKLLDLSPKEKERARLYHKQFVEDYHSLKKLAQMISEILLA